MPVQAQTSGFILGEGPGKLVDSLIAAGYANASLYQALLGVRAVANPSISGVVTDAFITSLASCQASSAVKANMLSSYAGNGVLINANCTAVANGG